MIKTAKERYAEFGEVARPLIEKTDGCDAKDCVLTIAVLQSLLEEYQLINTDHN